MKKLMKKLSIDDVLTKEDVKTLEKADAKQTATNEAIAKAEELDAMRKKAGRPKKTGVEKAKPRTLYFSDVEWAEIEKYGSLNGLKAIDFIKRAISKEIKREKGF